MFGIRIMQLDFSLQNKSVSIRTTCSPAINIYGVLVRTVALQAIPISPWLRSKVICSAGSTTLPGRRWR